MSNGPHADQATTVNTSHVPDTLSSLEADHVNATTDEPSGGDPPDGSSASTMPWQERFSSKRKAILDTFFNSVDSVVLVELMTIYYLECVLLP